MNYKEELEKELKEYERNNSYRTRIAGDLSKFRYPHMWEIEDNFILDENINSFLLCNNIQDTISKMSISDIIVYELMNPLAKRVDLCNLFGYDISLEEKYRAFNSLRNEYLVNKKYNNWPWPHYIKKLSVKDIKVRDEFEYLNKFINKSRNCDIYYYEFRKPIYMFQHGSTLKGTNVFITDDNKANFYQELFHTIYHLEETILGFNDDNMNILEIWGDPDALYIKELFEGAKGRCIRNDHKSRDIKSMDYLFLKAYLGTAFKNDDEKLCFHSLFSLIEPTIKLLMCCLPGDIKNKNRIIIDAICYNKTENLISSFDNIFGEGSYKKVFFDNNLFNRLNTIKDLCDENDINYDSVLDVMFNDEAILPTVISSDVVKYIWENEEVNQDKDFIINLLEKYSKLAREDKKMITMNNLKDYLGNSLVK